MILFNTSSVANATVRLPLELPDLQSELLREKQIITVQELYVSPHGKLKPTLPSQAWTSVGLVYDFDQIWLLSCEAVSNLSSLVGGSIIDDQNFNRTVCLCHDTLHGLNKQPGPVVDGDDGTHQFLTKIVQRRSN